MRGMIRRSPKSPSVIGEFWSDLGQDAPNVTPIGGGEALGRPYTGTKALMVAVLDNGIASYFSHTPRIHAEAELWLAHAGHESPVSFTVVCETLGLEAEPVRMA